MGRVSLGENRTIHYALIDGVPKAPYLVFLHEGLGSISMWKGFPERLCRRTGCPGMVYDRTGYGLSSPLNSGRTVHYLHYYALWELPAVIATVIPEAPYILVGHSDGGSMGLIFAAEKPSLLKGVITEAAHVFVEPETISGIRAAEESFFKGELDGLYKYHGENTYSTFTAWSETWLSDWFRHWNIEYLLPSIECPVLAVQGNEDPYGTKRQVDAIVSAAGGAAASCFVPDCGHSPHLEQPSLMVETMSEFIGKNR